MARISLRTAFTALALTIAAVGGATLASGDAAAKGGFGGGFKGGGFHKHVHFHGGGFRRHWGPRFVGYVGVPYVGGCIVKKVIDYEGDIVLKKVCY